MPTYAPWQEYALAYGNNNAASLQSIESITPSGDRGFVAVQGYSSYDEGIVNVRQDGLIYISGYPTAAWVFSALTRKQYQYLQSNYTVGGTSLSGYVTVRTRKEDGTFANFNAVLLLPKLPELNRRRKLYQDVTIRFVRLVAI